MSTALVYSPMRQLLRPGDAPMSALQQELHLERQQRLARFAAAAKRAPELPAPAKPPPIQEEPVAPKELPRIEDMPKHPSWFWIINEVPKEHPRISDIQRAVALHYKVEREDILSQRRSADVVRPRQIAIYLSKKLTLKSLPEIGRRFGGRDHTTVLHAIRRIEELSALDGEMSDALVLLTAMLKGNAPEAAS